MDIKSRKKTAKKFVAFCFFFSIYMYLYIIYISIYLVKKKLTQKENDRFCGSESENFSSKNSGTAILHTLTFCWQQFFHLAAILSAYEGSANRRIITCKNSTVNKGAYNVPIYRPYVYIIICIHTYIYIYIQIHVYTYVYIVIYTYMYV